VAIPSTAIWEVETGGSDTLNGGSFDTASTGKPTDLAATSATTASPVVTSATYNFVAGDVGNWVYVQAGTNWTPGWYKIASVAANAATLDATIGHAVLANGALSTATGCATTGSPTGGTWAVDYSQVAAVPFSLTGLTTAAANAIILTASATKAMVGNGIQITGGTNFTTGFYIVTAATAGVSLTVDRNCTTAAGAAGTAGLGGALATPSKAFSLGVAQNRYWIQFNASPYTQSANPTMNAGNADSTSTKTPNRISGYNTVRGDNPTGATRPTLQALAGCTTVIPLSTVVWWVENIIIDCNSQANVGLSNSATFTVMRAVKVINFKQYGINLPSTALATLRQCEVASGVSGATAGINASSAPCIIDACYVHDNLCTGIIVGVGAGSTGLCVRNSIIYNNTGASSDGIQCQYGLAINNCIFYGNGRDGIRVAIDASDNLDVTNNILVNNGGYGLNFSSANQLVGGTAGWDNNFYYNNTSGARNNCGTGVADIIGTANPFVSAGTNFGLNSTAGGGAACKAAGIPGMFPGLTSTTGFLDIGAVQHADPAAGGIIPVNLNAGIRG